MRTALALAVSVVALASCGAGQVCPRGCPAPDLGTGIGVTTLAATGVNNVQATLTGPVAGTLSCQTSSAGTYCLWPLTVAPVAGTYSLQVSAPGYQATTIQVEVTTPPPGACGCSADSIQPSTVVLSPSDGGMD